MAVRIKKLHTHTHKKKKKNSRHDDENRERERERYFFSTEQETKVEQVEPKVSDRNLHTRPTGR